MKKWIYNLLIGIFAAVFLVSAVPTAWYYIDAGKQADRYHQLSQTNGRLVVLAKRVA